MATEGRKLINPIVNYDDKGRITPLYEVGSEEFNEVIDRNVPGSIRGSKLYTRVGGYDLFTDIDDTIVIDRRGANIFIVRDKIEDEITPVNEREYLLLLVGLDDSSFEDTFRGIIGRQEVFDTVVEIADLIDLQKSKILAETTQLKGAITIFEFMKMCVDKNLVKNPTGFDPYEYEDIVYGDLED